MLLIVVENIYNDGDYIMPHSVWFGIFNQAFQYILISTNLGLSVTGPSGSQNCSEARSLNTS